MKSGEPGSSFPEPLPGDSHRMPLIPQHWLVTTHEMYTRELSKHSAPTVFTGGQSPRSPLPNTYPNSRLSEGGQICGIKRTVCTNRSGTESLLSLGKWWDPPQTQVLRHQLKWTLPAGLGPCRFPLFCPGILARSLLSVYGTILQFPDAQLNVYRRVLTNLTHLYYFVLMSLALQSRQVAWK